MCNFLYRKLWAYVVVMGASTHCYHCKQAQKGLNWLSWDYIWVISKQILLARDDSLDSIPKQKYCAGSGKEWQFSDHQNVKMFYAPLVNST